MAAFDYFHKLFVAETVEHVQQKNNNQPFYAEGI